MKQFNNPAARFLKILNKGKSVSKNSTCTQAWSELLDIPVSNTPLLLNRVSKVLALPNEIEEKISILKNQNQALLLKWLPRANGAINNMNFQRKWETFTNVFDNEIVYGIEFCADVLSRQCPEKLISNDDLDSISTQIDDLIEFVENDDIDLLSKQFILQSLYSLKQSIEEMPICGIRGMEDSYNSIIGSVIVNNYTEISSKESISASKFWDILGKIAIVFAIVTGPIAIGEKVINLIPEHTESLPNEKHDIKKDIITSSHKQQPKIIKKNREKL